MIAMIMVPILGLTVVAVTVDMFRLRPAEQYARQFGSSDAALVWRVGGPLQQDWSGREFVSEADVGTPEQVDAGAVVSLLPPGSRVTGYDKAVVSLRTAAGVGDLPAHAVDAADPLAAKLVAVLRGTAPRTAGEIALTERAAERLGVAVGETVRAGRSEQAWRVTAIVEFPSDLGQAVLFASDAMPMDAEQREPTVWLARTPRPIVWADVERLNRSGVVVMSRVVFDEPPSPGQTAYPHDGRDGDDDPAPLDLAFVVAALALLEIVLLAGPAFAVGARQRQRDLALIAVNGARPAHLRRIVLADGVVAGVAAAVVGVAVGIALAFSTRPAVETYLVGSRAGGYRVFPLALAAVVTFAVVAGVLAALLPAIAASRLDPVAALAARRGARRARKRWLAVGVLTGAIGGATSIYGALHARPSAVLSGLVLTEVGFALCIPPLIGLLAALGPILPTAARIGLRDAARNRASTAPAVAAVMAAVAGSVAVGIFLTGEQQRQDLQYRAGIPAGWVSIGYEDKASRLSTVELADNPVMAAARATLPVKDIVATSGLACAGETTAGDYCTLTLRLPRDQRCFMLDLPQPYTAEQQRRARLDRRCDADGGGVREGSSISGVVKDVRELRLLTQASEAELAQAQRVIEAGGVVVRDPRYITQGQVSLAIRDSRKPNNGQEVPEDELPTITVPAFQLTTGYGRPGQYFLSEPAVVRAGLAARPNGVVVITSRVPTESEEDRLRQELLAVSSDISRYASIERGSGVRPDPMVLVLAVIAAFIALAATAVATGLAAVDRRADLATLGAVGASGRIRRSIAVTQAALIAGLGSLLGVAVGGATALTMLATYNEAIADQWPRQALFPLAVPRMTVYLALLIPLVALLGAALFTRSRLPIERPPT